MLEELSHLETRTDKSDICLLINFRWNFIYNIDEYTNYLSNKNLFKLLNGEISYYII